MQTQNIKAYGQVFWSLQAYIGDLGVRNDSILITVLILQLQPQQRLKPFKGTHPSYQGRLQVATGIPYKAYANMYSRHIVYIYTH